MTFIHDILSLCQCWLTSSFCASQASSNSHFTTTKWKSISLFLSQSFTLFFFVIICTKVKSWFLYFAHSFHWRFALLSFVFLLFSFREWVALLSLYENSRIVFLQCKFGLLCLFICCFGFCWDGAPTHLLFCWDEAPTWSFYCWVNHHGYWTIAIFS